MKNAFNSFKSVVITLIGLFCLTREGFSGLFNICKLMENLKGYMEEVAPNSICLDFIKVCDTPVDEVDLTFWREKWTKAFRIPYEGECPPDTFNSVINADKSLIERNDNLNYIEGKRKSINTSSGNVEGISIRFTSQVWKCFQLIHYGVLMIPENRTNPDFAIIFNSGSQPSEGSSFPDPVSFQDIAELASELGVIVLKITTDQPPRRFVEDGYLWDVYRVVSELNETGLQNMCKIFSDLFLPYVTADAALRARDMSYDFRMPMGNTLRRAITLLEWKFGVKKVILTGGSQWGISLFLPAVADSRVAAIFSAGMHGLLDMEKYLQFVVNSNFTYGIYIITPTLARDFLEEMQDFSEYNSLSPVNFKFLQPLFITGGSGDEFYPIEGFGILQAVSAQEKHLYISPNRGHGFMGTETIDNRKAFFSHIITGYPEFDYRIEVKADYASGEDWIVEAEFSSADEIEGTALWWACDNDRDGSFNNDKFNKVEGIKSPGVQTFVILDAKRCSSFTYFLEMYVSAPPYDMRFSSEPEFPRGSPAFRVIKNQGCGCVVAQGSTSGEYFFILILLAVILLFKLKARENQRKKSILKKRARGVL